MVKIINGKEISKSVLTSLKQQVSTLKTTPKLAVVLVGNNSASEIYVRNKVRVGKEIGIDVEIIRVDEDITESTLIDKIEVLNEDDHTDGIIVQLPLPSHIDESKVINKVSADKDVDGFTVESSGRLMQGLSGFRSCTPAGIMYLIDEIDYNLEGKNALVIGRSNIVGLPIAKMLLDRNATVTTAHSKTANLSEYLKIADIIVVAVGQAEFLKGEHLKSGVVIIDVGINRLENKKIVGDVDYEDVVEKASWITPVPGGVGPMTIAMLMKNTMEAHLRKGERND